MFSEIALECRVFPRLLMILAHQNPALVRIVKARPSVLRQYRRVSLSLPANTAVMWQMLLARLVWGIFLCAAKECEEAPMLQMSERREFFWFLLLWEHNE